jgi:hypothetical protein
MFFFELLIRILSRFTFNEEKKEKKTFRNNLHQVKIQTVKEIYKRLKLVKLINFDKYFILERDNIPVILYMFS